MITKKELKRYIRLRDQADDIAKRIVYLRRTAESSKAVRYDSDKVQSHYNGSTQENYAVRIVKLIVSYERKLDELTALIARIEEEISSLPDEDARLIRLRYFDDLPCRKCAELLYVSESTFHRWHSRVLGELAGKK